MLNQSLEKHGLSFIKGNPAIRFSLPQKNWESCRFYRVY